MTRYRRIIELLRRPLAVLGLLAGLFILVEAILVGRGAHAYMVAVPLIGGSLVDWYVPSGRRAHPPSESTLQWARKQRRGQG
jgi:hypothetical protein